MTDNGLPPLANTFSKTFSFIKSKSDIYLSNNLIPVTSKANAKIGEIKLNDTQNLKTVIFKIHGVTDGAFQINKTDLLLTKDADQLPNSNIIIRIIAVNSVNNLQIAEANIRLEIIGRSVCQSNSNNCHKNATCKSLDSPNQFNCSCNAGYQGNGVNCAEIDECSSNPCLGNGSTCIDKINGFLCHCGSGRSGSKCEIAKTTNCANLNCNHGICNGNNACLCFSGWQGAYCNESFNFCVGQPCNKQGICVNQLDGYFCFCFKNFSGASCEHNDGQCAKCKPRESCITMVDKTTHCVKKNKILTINFQIPEGQDAKNTNYQNDLLKSLQSLPKIQNHSIYLNVTELEPKNFQLGFTAIDSNGTALSGNQSLNILKGFCNNTGKLFDVSILFVLAIMG